LSKKTQIKLDSIVKLLHYILGYRPDEFGLVPDPDGYVPIKELLKVIHEEENYGYVHESHIREILLGPDRFSFERVDQRIRGLDRQWDPDFSTPCPDLPVILFTPIRRRAHAHVMEKGLSAGDNKYLLLTPEKDFAERVGRRTDPEPVLLEILAHEAGRTGNLFTVFGDLFLTKEIPVRFIAGPPVPKEVIEQHTLAQQQKAQKEKPIRRQLGFEAGTFALQLSKDPADKKQRVKGKKVKGWKEEVRGMRRTKR
jgi:putative RNA 2'-phosphotransferase